MAVLDVREVRWKGMFVQRHSCQVATAGAFRYSSVAGKGINLQGLMDLFLMRRT